MSDFNSFSAISSLSALRVWNEPHDCASQHVSIVDDMQVAAPKGLQVKLQLVVILSCKCNRDTMLCTIVVVPPVVRKLMRVMTVSCKV
jgi:hypothetical protein